MTVVSISFGNLHCRCYSSLCFPEYGLYGSIREPGQPVGLSPLGHHPSHYRTVLHGVVLCVSLDCWFTSRMRCGHRLVSGAGHKIYVYIG